MNELKTIDVAMLQSICGWSDFNHDGTWEETEEL
jgi:hypothetical protein